MYSEPVLPFAPSQGLSTSGIDSMPNNNTLTLANLGVVHQPQPILLRLSSFTHLLVPIDLTLIQTSESTLTLRFLETLDCGLDRFMATSTPIPIPREGKVTFGEPVFRRPTEDELVYIRGLSSPSPRVVRVNGDHNEKVFLLMPSIAALPQPQPNTKPKTNGEIEQTTDLEENEKEGGLSGWEGDDEGESDCDSDDAEALHDGGDTRVSLPPPRWFARAASSANRSRRYTIDLSF